MVNIILFVVRELIRSDRVEVTEKWINIEKAEQKGTRKITLNSARQKQVIHNISEQGQIIQHESRGK